MSRPLAAESVYRAIAHPVRRIVLDSLRKEERSVGEIHQMLARLSRPALSNHMRVLRESGLLTQRRKGVRLMCSLNIARMTELVQWMVPFQSMLADASLMRASRAQVKRRAS